MGGNAGGEKKNDIWKSVDGGALWILVTDNAAWSGEKKIIISRDQILQFLMFSTFNCFYSTPWSYYSNTFWRVTFTVGGERRWRSFK